MRKKVKRKKKHHLNRLKTRKAGSSWFKLVYFDIFLLIYFRFSTIIITFATKYQFKHTSNNLKRYINLKSATIIQYTIKGRFMSR